MRTPITAFLCLLFTYDAFSQNCLPANAGPDKTICFPGSTLIGTDDDMYLFSYQWAPGVGLDNTNTAQPNANPNVTTTYTLTKTPKNLLINGDFELGVQGLSTFTSDYTLHTISIPGRYGLTTNPRTQHPDWCQITDHTPTGSGIMLWADGAFNTNLRVWSQTVKVVPGYTYNFSGWAYTLSLCDPLCDPRLEVRINNQVILTNFHVAFQNCVPNGWVQFQGTWTAAPGEIEAELSIRSMVYLSQGSDFALDDLSLVINCPETTDQMNVNVIGAGQTAIASGSADISNGYDPPVTLSMSSPNEICYPWENGVTVTLQATNASGNTWYIDNVPMYDGYYSTAVGWVTILNNSQTLRHAPYPSMTNRSYKISYNNGSCTVGGPPVNARFVSTFYPNGNWLGFVTRNTWEPISAIDYGPNATYTWSFPSGVYCNPISSNSPNADIYISSSFVSTYDPSLGIWPVHGYVTISNSPYLCANGTYGVYVALPSGRVDMADERIRSAADSMKKKITLKKIDNDIYPNPAGNSAKVITDLKVSDVRSIALINSEGRKVKDLKYRENGAVIELDLIDIPQGMYFVTVKTSKEIRNYKLVIAK